jgi:hypothetical protein
LLFLAMLLVKKSIEMDKEIIKKLHESVWQQIGNKNEQYTSKSNKDYRWVIFKHGDWVWMHMRKEKFPTQKWFKLHSRGNGSFQVIE